MKTISSTKNPIIKNLKKLALKKYREQTQTFIVEGWHLVSEALIQKCVKVIFVLDEVLVCQKLQNLINYNSNIKTFKVSNNIIATLTNSSSPQPILAVCASFTNNRTDDNNILILDDIQDPSNLGAILRICVAFGINSIFLSKNSVDLYNHKVISASQGAIFKVKCFYGDIIKTIKELQLAGYYFFGTVLKEKQCKFLSDINFQRKNAFIFGNEGQGIRKEIHPYINENFIIPTSTNVESLNVAISVAITFFWLFNNKK